MCVCVVSVCVLRVRVCVSVCCAGARVCVWTSVCVWACVRVWASVRGLVGLCVGECVCVRAYGCV